MAIKPTKLHTDFAAYATERGDKQRKELFSDINKLVLGIKTSRGVTDHGHYCLFAEQIKWRRSAPIEFGVCIMV